MAELNTDQFPRPRPVVDTVGFRISKGTRYRATNRMTGEQHENLTATEMQKITKAGIKQAKAQGFEVDEFGRVAGHVKLPGED